MENVKLGKIIGGSVLTITVILIFGFVVGNLELANYKFWAVKHANVKREIFEETKSYNQGKTQQLSKYFLEWKTGDTEKKEAIKFVILHQFADYKSDRLEPGLANFLIQMRGY